MTPTLAAASGSGGTGALVLLALAVTAGYVLACWIWPFAACRNRFCVGGKIRSPSGRTWRTCPRCHGTGRRVRAGRRVWTYLHRTYDAGTDRPSQREQEDDHR